MKELIHKLKEKSVGADTSVHSFFKGKTKCNKGITLIALIITIVVMLILVGVTVTFTVGENGILNQAKEALIQNEEQTIYERIIGATQLTDKGKIDVKETYNAVKSYLESQGKTIALRTPETEEEIVNNVTFDVIGKKGTYSYAISTEKIIQIKGDFKINIEKWYSQSKNALYISITPEITADLFTEKEAVEYVANEMLGINNVSTLEQLDVELYNFLNDQEDEENPLYGKDDLDNFEDLSKEYKNYVATEEEPTAKEIFAYIFSQIGGAPADITVQDLYLANYVATERKIRINGQEIENASWDDNEVTSVKIDKNGNYEIEIELDGKIGRDLIGVNDIIENIGKYVTYDLDGDGLTTDENLYIVLYDEKELGENEGAQIISATRGPYVKIGYLDPTIDESNIKDVDGDNDLRLEKSIESFNNATETLNNACKALNLEKEGITNGVRSVGTNPLNPTEDYNIKEYYTEADVENYVIGTDTWFKPYSGLIKKRKIGENRDIKRMKDLYIVSNAGYYWVADYGITYMNNEYGILIQVGISQISSNTVAYVKSGVNIHADGFLYPESGSEPLRPVLSLKPGVLEQAIKNNSNSGTKEDPYVLQPVN